MEVVFDIFNDYKAVFPHKKANIAKKGREVLVTYDGNLSSSGFRTTLDTTKGYWYRITVDATLIRGDVCFIYCESITAQRLIERKYFITDTVNSYRVAFKAVGSKTYVGLLFYNDGDYELAIRKFRVESNKNGFDSKDTEISQPREHLDTKADIIKQNIKQNYAQNRRDESELDEIVYRNSLIVQEILRESHSSRQKITDDYCSDETDDEELPSAPTLPSPIEKEVNEQKNQQTFDKLNLSDSSEEETISPPIILLPEVSNYVFVDYGDNNVPSDITSETVEETNSAEFIRLSLKKLSEKSWFDDWINGKEPPNAEILSFIDGLKHKSNN